MSVSKSSSGAYKLQNLVAVFYGYRRVSVEKLPFEPRRAASLVSKFGYGDSGYHGLRLFSVSSGIDPKSDTPECKSIQMLMASEPADGSSQHVTSLQIVTSLQLYDPSLELLSRENRTRYTTICLPMYRAALKGDWEAGRRIIQAYPAVVRCAITKRRETALHIAAAAMHIHFVEELVKEMVIKDEKEKIQQSSQVLPSPSKPGFWTWTKWILGSVLLPFVLPFWTNKWVNLLMIKGEVETVVEEVENAAEVVEKAAVSVEKVAAEVADKLPENGRLKEAALLLEHASSVTAKDAKFTEDLIHKVEKLEHDLNDLETMVEPIIDRIVPKDHQRK